MTLQVGYAISTVIFLLSFAATAIEPALVLAALMTWRPSIGAIHADRITMRSDELFS